MSSVVETSHECRATPCKGCSFLLTSEEKEPKKTATPKAPFKEPTEKVQNVKWINSGFR